MQAAVAVQNNKRKKIGGEQLLGRQLLTAES